LGEKDKKFSKGRIEELSLLSSDKSIPRINYINQERLLLLMRKEIDNWWKQAEADLRSAGNRIKSEDYYLAVFSCQQAVEKALKAL